MPEPIPGWSNIIDLSDGYTHTCVVATGVTLQCLWSNESGQLGNGDTMDSRTPVDVAGLTGATDVEVGNADSSFTCARHASGVSCWGSNSVGELGNNTAVLPTCGDRKSVV